jgi:hypothetical protein
MTVEKIQAWTQFVLSWGTIIGPICAVILAKWRRDDKKVKEARGDDVDGDPPIVGLAPLALIALAGATWVYLLSQNPRIAELVLPEFEPMGFAAVSPVPVVAYCTKDGDCASGRCDRGRCMPSPEKPLPERARPRPRAVGDLAQGTLCTGCDDHPLVMEPIEAVALR